MSVHTNDLKDVRAAEEKYLAERRNVNDLPSLNEDPDLWGVSLSGGGVRSATFCLGVIQALTRFGHMKRFDYMSTVSGGGYIGSCLTSLLSGRTDTGLDDKKSPFTGLRKNRPYAEPDKTELSARHQLHHLRTHGEYLIPRSHFLSRDVQRALGSALSGMSYTLLLFFLLFVCFVAAVHLGLTAVERDLDTIAPAAPLLILGEADEAPSDECCDEMGYLEYVRAVLGAWYSQHIAPPFVAAFDDLKRYPLSWLGFGFLAFVWCLAWIVGVTRKAGKAPPGKTPPEDETRAGWTWEDELESAIVRWFNFTSVAIVVVALVLCALLYQHWEDTDRFLAALLLPAVFSLTGFATIHLCTYLFESGFARRTWKRVGGSHENRLRRSFYASLRGAALYGVATAVGVPVLLVFLFSLSDVPLKFFAALAALAWSYYSARKRTDTTTPMLGGWLHRPLANAAVLLFLSFAFAEVSARLLRFYRLLDPSQTWVIALAVAIVAFLMFVVVGMFIDANRAALHYFYRDRLTEAYLKTDARTLRANSDQQGMPLTVLRDCEDLKLSNLGAMNRGGPYHLIVAALNLTGSRELNRKSFLSEHFLFSKYYVGSRVTGWVKTRQYRRNTTRLARAMAISAAAVGSAMGQHTFGAQAFVTTLFNARLGYWMENPWTYRHGVRAKKRHLPTFWPKYLILEIFGLTSAREPLVNVSDGGHTGDNLGLLPLLQRRCKTIVVCDAEADGDYSFTSFNNAVRMAFIEENIKIDINLDPVHAQPVLGRTGVVVGRIVYPEADPEAPPARLVYIKSSLSSSSFPVHVANYAKAHEAFPHETTADQFFDDAQFEAYRALGNHLGEQASRYL